MVPCDIHTMRNDNVLECHRSQLLVRIFVSPNPHVFEITVDHPIGSRGEISLFPLSSYPVVTHYKLRSSLY